TETPRRRSGLRSAASAGIGASRAASAEIGASRAASVRDSGPGTDDARLQHDSVIVLSAPRSRGNQTSGVLLTGPSEYGHRSRSATDMHTRQLPIGSTYSGSHSSPMGGTTPAALDPAFLNPAVPAPAAVRAPAVRSAPVAHGPSEPVTYGRSAPIVV